MRLFALLAFAVCFTLGSLFVIGRILTRRFETAPGAVAAWGPNT
jgi:hypothetical protein